MAGQRPGRHKVRTPSERAYGELKLVQRAACAKAGRILWKPADAPDADALRRRRRRPADRTLLDLRLPPLPAGWPPAAYAQVPEEEEGLCANRRRMDRRRSGPAVRTRVSTRSRPAIGSGVLLLEVFGFYSLFGKSASALISSNLLGQRSDS